MRTPPKMPPSTRPSGPERVIVNPPLLVREPSLSVSKYDPDKLRISKRPCNAESILSICHRRRLTLTKVMIHWNNILYGKDMYEEKEI